MKNELSDMMRFRRLSFGLTQRELALRCGCTARTIRNVETGRWMPRPALLKRLCEELRFELVVRPERMKHLSL